MGKLFLLIITIVVFSSCASKFGWNRPSQEYRECLRKNPDDESRCDMYKELYEERIDSLREISDNPASGGGIYSK